MRAGGHSFPAVNSTLGTLADEQLRELAPEAHLAAVGALAGGVVHELSNPLFAILALVELMLADSEPGSPFEERLRLVQQTGLEMSEGLRTLRPLLGARTGDAPPASLAGGARTAAALFGRTSDATRLALVERYPDEPVQVEIGPETLTQLVLHLLLHARRALAEPARVEVEVVAGDPAVLEVRYEPALEVAAGLGLLVARHAVTELGGSLEHSLEAGAGCLRLSLPAAG